MTEIQDHSGGAFHTVSSFDADLKSLMAKVAGMGALVEREVTESIAALMGYDVALAEAVRRLDTEADSMQREIEESAITMIARRQPMAVDLRQIISAIRICHDLERVGDMAKNIAKRVTKLDASYLGLKSLLSFRNLSDLVIAQLHEVMVSYSDQDAARAVNVWRSDGQIDTQHSALFRELLAEMMADQAVIPICTHLLFCAKNIERIGDHATNIAENVHYVVVGQLLPEDRPKGKSGAAGQASNTED